MACSDSQGYVLDEDGLDLDLLSEIKDVRRERLSAYADERGNCTYFPGRSVWDVECDIALPCATQNELDGDAARTLLKDALLAQGALTAFMTGSGACVAGLFPDPEAGRKAYGHFAGLPFRALCSTGDFAV